LAERLEIYIAERRDTPGAWTVEVTDPEDGAVYQAIFIGPEAEERAREYAGDPMMPRVMPPEVERELQNLMGYRARPNPVDVYHAIRDELVRLQERR
jgi:hypothetical protein